MGSTRNKAAMCLAAITLATGAVVAITSGSTAHAATVDCGSACAEPYSHQYGNTAIAAVDAGGVQPGLGVGLSAAGTYSIEDFEINNFGPVSDFYQDGLVGPVVGQTWPTDETYQYNYAPDGVLSGLCLGLADTASTGEGVTLQPCGVDANTVWIALSADEIDGYQPMINATDTIVDTPYVLTAVKGRFVLRGTSDIDLEVEPLSLVSGTLNPAQMWTNEFGVVGG
jgi:hypothetical protein